MKREIKFRAWDGSKMDKLQKRFAMWLGISAFLMNAIAFTAVMWKAWMIT